METVKFEETPENKIKLFKAELNACETMQEILHICARYYDLNNKLGIISKTAIVSNIDKIIKLSGAKLK